MSNNSLNTNINHIFHHYLNPTSSQQHNQLNNKIKYHQNIQNQQKRLLDHQNRDLQIKTIKNTIEYCFHSQQYKNYKYYSINQQHLKNNQNYHLILIKQKINNPNSISNSPNIKSIVSQSNSARSISQTRLINASQQILSSSIHLDQQPISTIKTSSTINQQDHHLKKQFKPYKRITNKMMFESLANNQNIKQQLKIYKNKQEQLDYLLQLELQKHQIQKTLQQQINIQQFLSKGMVQLNVFIAYFDVFKDNDKQIQLRILNGIDIWINDLKTKALIDRKIINNFNILIIQNKGNQTEQVFFILKFVFGRQKIIQKETLNTLVVHLLSKIKQKNTKNYIERLIRSNRIIQTLNQVKDYHKFKDILLNAKNKQLVNNLVQLVNVKRYK